LKRSTEVTLRAWILAVAYLALIFAVSSIPQSTLSQAVFKLSDKVAHLAEYTGFGLLLTVAFRGTLRRAPRWLLVVVVVLVGAGVGALDETYQLTVPGRERELLDWIADVVGVILGAGLSIGLRSWLARRRAAANGSAPKLRNAGTNTRRQVT
jgi:VanZ family protein